MRAFLIALMIITSPPPLVEAQPFRQEGGRASERVEQLKKLRLIETLNMTEEQSVRFFARLNEHEKMRRDLMDRKTEVLDRLDRMVRNEVEESEYRSMFPEVLAIDSELAAEDNRFFEKLNDILSEEQRAKFLLFGRQFQKELREALREVQRRRAG
jgi:hypothetical protein